MATARISGYVLTFRVTLAHPAHEQIPLFTFPTVESPRFPKGYPASVAFDFGLWAIVMFGFWFMARRASRALQSPETGSQGTVADSQTRAASDKDLDDEPALAGQVDGTMEPAIGVQRLDIKPVH